MRINYRHTSTLLNIIVNHIFHQGGFTGASLADDVHMESPVFLFNPEFLFFIAKINFSEDRQLFGADGFSGW